MVCNSGSKMYSIAGKIGGDNIQWAEGQNIPQFIANGHYPKVAINDKKIAVEVHKSQWWHTIWYRVGTLEEGIKAIDWSNKAHPLGNAGCNPAIALSNEGTVVITYEQNSETFYCVGKVNQDTTEVTWQDPGVGRQLFNIPTKEPSISMNENGLMVAAARTCNNNCKIVFRIGTFEKLNTILWKEVDQDASRSMHGWGPVVAINKKNRIISVHMSLAGRKLRMKCGIINADSKRIEWSEEGKPLDFGFGMYPSVTMNCEDQVVRMNEVSFGSYSMFYEVGEFLNQCED